MRIIRACREMGICTVAVCSEADREALHAQLADECICIGGARPADSYLNMESILSAAVASGIWVSVRKYPICRNVRALWNCFYRSVAGMHCTHGR